MFIWVMGKGIIIIIINESQVAFIESHEKRGEGRLSFEHMVLFGMNACILGT